MPVSRHAAWLTSLFPPQPKQPPCKKGGGAEPSGSKLDTSLKSKSPSSKHHCPPACLSNLLLQSSQAHFQNYLPNSGTPTWVHRGHGLMACAHLGTGVPLSQPFPVLGSHAPPSFTPPASPTSGGSLVLFPTWRSDCSRCLPQARVGTDPQAPLPIPLPVSVLLRCEGRGAAPRRCGLTVPPGCWGPRCA